MTTLLVLVDLQHDFLAAPGLEPSAGETVRRAAMLLDTCRARGDEVVHVRTTISREDDRRMAHWKRDGRWLCVEGTAGHETPPALAERPGEHVVEKTAFGSGGELARLLDRVRPDVVLVAGVHLHTCVRAAALEAYEHGGADVRIVFDACASGDPLHAASALRWMERRLGPAVSVAWVLAVDGLADLNIGISEEVGSAVRGCREALRAWQRLSLVDRSSVLLRLADRLEAEAGSYATDMASSIGKPVTAGTIETERTAVMLRAVVERVLATGDDEASPHAAVRRRPLGVVASVSPWNSPVYITLGKIAPALMFGNAVVWKPAPAAHATSERLVRALVGAGAPDGLVSLVEGGREAAAAVMAHPEVDAVTITGGALAGFAAQEVCGARRIPLQAELGGNNAALVWDDAELDHAAAELAFGAFVLAGQRCTANRRVVVHETVRGELLERLERATAALAWGDPHDPATVVGPIVSAAERDRITDAVARAGGRTITPHAQPPAGDGAWYPPTIVVTDDPAEEIVQHETFGPVLVVQTARDWQHAMALVNGVRQGLAASIFSASEEIVERFLDEAQAGILKVGTSTADAEVDVPFGGWKWSGIGPPEHGSFDRDFYTRPQAVYPARVPVG